MSKRKTEQERIAEYQEKIKKLETKKKIRELQDSLKKKK